MHSKHSLSLAMTRRKPFNLRVCLFSTSIVFVVLGVILLVLKSILYNFVIDSIFSMSPSSSSFAIWSKSEIPLGFDVYIFNWTNPEDFYNLTSKPAFEQLGPYRFYEYVDKVDVEFFPNDTITFRRLKRWIFRPEESVGSLDDLVTSINPVAVSAGYTLRDWSYLFKKGLSMAFSKLSVTPEITRSVRDMLFEGYDEPLLDAAKKLPFFNSLPSMEKFGWFYSRNGSKTFDGIFNMGTGGSHQMGQLYQWNNWSHTPFYKKHCGDVWGSAGEFFGQNLRRDFVTLFHSDVCRAVSLDYEKDAIISNIKGYKYVIGDRFLDNGTLYPENHCFCTGECVPSGAVNVSSCKYGSPGFVSLPHFYKADDYYLSKLEGLQPDEKLHEFYMILEPRTGIPLKVAAKLQLNLLVQNISYITLYENAPKLFFPVLWFEQVVTIPDNLAFLLRILLNMPVICLSIGIIMISMGLVLLTCVSYKVCTTNIFEKRRNERLYFKETIPLNPESKSSMLENR